MDYITSCQFLVRQASLTETKGFLSLLHQGLPPIPGQVTNILLALKMIFQQTETLEHLDRNLVYILHRLAYDSRRNYDQHKLQGLLWPPLLNEDLDRIAQGVNNIFSRQWQD